MNELYDALKKKSGKPQMTVQEFMNKIKSEQKTVMDKYKAEKSKQNSATFSPIDMVKDGFKFLKQAIGA